MKLFLLDAYALIYRSYYAFIKSPRVNSKGFNTSAVFGFVNTLEEVLKKENPTHIAVVFDPPGPTFRHEAYEQYKAQRQETPEDIKLSVPIIKDVIDAYNIKRLEVLNYEADDVIGTIAKKAEQEGIEVYMMTPDKDYGQLTSQKVFMYKPKFAGSGFDVLDDKAVMEKYKINSPLLMIDLLGLMGDASDNIPGCPGVGPKTAEKLIADYGTIENILENTDQIKGSLKTKLEENKEQILFSKFLATIKIDVDIDFEKDDFLRKDINQENLEKIFHELE
ncbi:MAG: polymerase, partial [Bacteroidota bacterium]